MEKWVRGAEFAQNLARLGLLELGSGRALVTQAPSDVAEADLGIDLCRWHQVSLKPEPRETSAGRFLREMSSVGARVSCPVIDPQ